MLRSEYKEAKRFYKKLCLMCSKYQFENSLGERIKCFGVAVPNEHAELHEKDIIVGLLEMAGPNPSFEDLVASVGLATFNKVDAIYGFAEPFQEAWEEIIGEKP